MKEPLTIALDAMGGDGEPLGRVQGALDFCRQTGNKVLLVGRPAVLEPTLAGLNRAGTDLEVVPAEQVIEFHDPIRCIREKRDSSIHQGIRLVRSGKASGFVSAGHTGAVMALSKVLLGLVEGVDRPALPAPFPRVVGGTTILLDVGANVDCEPEHFRQFAVMGYLYARRFWGVENPRVGLLSIGEEDSKGNLVLREVAGILRETRINFVGNVEGNDLLKDRAEVVVCDGFVGNVTLKVAEGIAEALAGLVKGAIMKSWLNRLAGLMLLPTFRPLREKIDYANYGGVPLLGVKGVTVVAHGRSSPRAICNALKVAEAAARVGMVERIAEDIAALHSAERRLSE